MSSKENNNNLVLVLYTYPSSLTSQEKKKRKKYKGEARDKTQQEMRNLALDSFWERKIIFL